MAYLTDEQKAYLCEQYGLGASEEAIAAAVNSMMGGTVSASSVKVLAHRMDVRRGEPRRRTDADFEPIVADFADVTDWAYDAGVGFTRWDDLPAVNNARFAAGLPFFARLSDNAARCARLRKRSERYPCR